MDKITHEIRIANWCSICVMKASRWFLKNRHNMDTAQRWAVFSYTKTRRKLH